ncbi:MAG: cutinase family protein [Mycobacteriaceae bacterium]|uniref:cutinase family protein n=1 Tax=Corynebacterium sp. TaxID=1720 RepID=UPI003F94D350
MSQERSGTWKIVLIVGAVVLIAAIALAVTLIIGGDDDTDTDASRCADVEFIGAAGSGQREADGEDAELPYSGVGEIVEQTYNNLSTDVPSDLSLNLRAVDYPALSVPQGFNQSEWEDFLHSAALGADAAGELITSTISECPDAQIVVAGYSQGAMAVRRALMELGPTEQVTGGVLIGDGDKMPDDNVTTVPGYGTDDREGIAQEVLELGFDTGTTRDVLPDFWQDRILSACQAGDLVCAPTSLGDSIDVTAHANYDADDWRDFLPDLVAGQE